MARTKRTARGSEASRAEAALVAEKARRAALAWEAAIRIMAAKPSDPDRLTKLPAELLDAIFADIYSPETRAKRLPEPLCKFLLPFQRRRYRSLTQRHPIGDQLDDEHLKELLSSAVSLERLHLHRLTNSDDQFPFLTLLTHPERFTELHVRYGYRYSEEIEDEATGWK